MKHSKKSIALVVCYIGNEFPAYFEYFLKTVSWNHSINIIIFSNISQTPLLPKNVSLIDFDLETFNLLATNKLGIQININTPYKLCDFKIAYGKIFEDYLKGYDFWGPVDIDCLLGNIRDFLNDAFLDTYDFISVRREFPSAFFSLYRNNGPMCNLFMESKDWKRVYSSDIYYAFDECNFAFDKIVKEKASILDIDTEIETMAEIIEKKKASLRIYMESVAHELQFRDLLEVTNNGIKHVETGQKFIIVHFISLNRHSFYNHRKLLDNNDKIFIDIFGIIPCAMDTALNTAKRNEDILQRRIVINYKEVVIDKVGKVTLGFSVKEGARISKNGSNSVEISRWDLFKTQVLLFIHHNPNTTCNDIVYFFLQSNVFAIQKEKAPSKYEIDILVLNIISVLMEFNHIFIQ